jgi:hypothetical protein|tara:strand:- start:7948 stop:8193 length:246 start_codon:yes stop_codon:yes gene_type:complete
MSTNVFKMVNGVTIELTEAENNQRLADGVTAQAEQDARAWLDGRLSEYPSMGDQMDTIFHSGVDVWKAEIQAIKDKYPKPV